MITGKKKVESDCLSREKQTDLVFSYMGPLVVLAHLALWHRNTLTETMNTRRTAAAMEVIRMSWPLLVPYQGASTVGQNETLGEMRITLPQLFVCGKKRSMGLKLSNLYCTLCMCIWTRVALLRSSGQNKIWTWYYWYFNISIYCNVCNLKASKLHLCAMG